MGDGFATTGQMVSVARNNKNHAGKMVSNNSSLASTIENDIMNINGVYLSRAQTLSASVVRFGNETRCICNKTPRRTHV